ncbi:Chanoclavine-I aldehyde reductase fgaOx3 [Paramyrothecium foliicola]|nr:Chanoclavine-I aldehyde reductase fgaOx3 [Paramyrothecium foliicola]
MSSTRLFEPITVGSARLGHRIVMAPLTRFRANDDHSPSANMLEYYTQRAATPGTLIIAEATYPSPAHTGGNNSPGLWSDTQIQGWKKITDAIHARGCYIYSQLCAPGRAGHIEGYPLYSSSSIPMEAGAPTPQEMTESEIWSCISDFKTAAQNAIRAGFDGIEIHGANGYLIDQFSQDKANQRTDAWGGSVENRSRFALEVARAVTEAIGGDKVGFRLSPWSNFQGMRMETGLATQQFSNIVRGLKEFHLSYIHLIESRVNNNIDTEKTEGLEWAFDIWNNQSPILVAGGMDGDRARHALDEEYKNYDVLAVFGRSFVSTPDLVYRLQNGLEPNQYDRSTFYTPVQTKGYTDYPFSKEYLASVESR